jgi:hypothetical protein
MVVAVVAPELLGQTQQAVHLVLVVLRLRLTPLHGIKRLQLHLV